MKLLSITALVLTAAMGAPVSAQNTTQNRLVFHNPCERGPLPHVSIINNERSKFVAFLQEIRPSMPRQTAQAIAAGVCDDMGLVWDSDGLTRRLNELLRTYGY